MIIFLFRKDNDRTSAQIHTDYFVAIACHKWIWPCVRDSSGSWPNLPFLVSSTFIPATTKVHGLMHKYIYISLTGRWRKKLQLKGYRWYIVDRIDKYQIYWQYTLLSWYAAVKKSPVVANHLAQKRLKI
jgi:hypothetical protein